MMIAKRTGFLVASLTIGLWCLALGGCERLKPPTFAALGVEPGENTPAGVVLRFQIEARNDNEQPIPLRRVLYSLSLDGQQVFAGARSAQITVPAFGVQSFDLPAVIPYDRPLPAGRVRYAIHGKIEYVEPGQLAESLFDAEVRVPEAPLKITGSVDLGLE